METKHTPFQLRAGSSNVVIHKNMTVAVFNEGAQGGFSAAHWVQAVNSHDALLRACEAFVDAETEYAEVRASMTKGTFIEDPLGDACKLAIAAIALAKGAR